MAVITTPRQKVGWGTANFVVIALALIPVLWMVSLSFKTPAAILDPSFIPKSWTSSNYSQILTTSQFIRPLINSIGIGLIATLIAVVLRVDGRLRDRPAGVPRQGRAHRHGAADRDVPADRARDSDVQHRALRWACSTPGPA